MELLKKLIFWIVVLVVGFFAIKLIIELFQFVLALAFGILGIVVFLGGIIVIGALYAVVVFIGSSLMIALFEKILGN